MKKQITEEENHQKEWYKETSSQTTKTLLKFINHLLNDYDHDYGTVCHALAAGAIATVCAMNKKEGITGFQAGLVMWEFIRNWVYTNNKTGLKIIDYDKFLYPQYKYYFQKTISKEIWKSIQEQAKKEIENDDKEHDIYIKNLKQYKIDLKKFIKKYPDYYKNKKHYDHLVSGTGNEIDEYHKKEKSGFEFAPQKPFEVVTSRNVYKHWVNIVKGKIPFGYIVQDDNEKN